MTKTRNNKYNTLILRELLPPPIAQCKINISPIKVPISALHHTASRRMSRAFLCLCLIIPTLFFASCESYEDPQNEVLKGYFEESKGLFQASTDSISRFSAKVKEFTTRIPEAKNDPLYTRIQENIRMATLRITIKIEDEWAGEKVISFDMVEHESHKSNKYGDPSP